MLKAILAALLSTAVAGEAAALSCLRPTVQSSFQAADSATAQYVLALGRVQLLPGEAIPEAAGDPNDRQGYTVRARFEGKLADRSGFETDASFPLTVQVDCAAAWCGGVPMKRILAFIERRGEENVLVEGPCPRFALNATPEVVEGALACLRGEACAPPE